MKLWPVLVTLVVLIGAAFTIKSDVDTLKENLGRPGSLQIIENNIERLGDQYHELKDILKEQDQEREELMQIMRSGQDKVDSLIDLLVKERSGKK